MNKNIYTNIKIKVKEKNKGFAQGVQWLKNYNISNYWGISEIFRQFSDLILIIFCDTSSHINIWKEKTNESGRKVQSGTFSINQGVKMLYVMKVWQIQCYPSESFIKFGTKYNIMPNLAFENREF